MVVPREDLLRAVWATEFVPDSTHVVDVHLANLRRKLRGAAGDNQWIRTIRGVGLPLRPLLPLTLPSGCVRLCRSRDAN